jgi:hypothetical protein
MKRHVIGNASKFTNPVLMARPRAGAPALALGAMRVRILGYFGILNGGGVASP